MNSLLDQIEASLGSGHYLLSLYTTLTIPDIAGALTSNNGRASRTKYVDWFERWVRPRFYETILASVPAEHRQYIAPTESPLTGDACYRFRCSLLHQGSTQHPESPYSRIMFVEPGAMAGSIHGCTLNDALCIDLNKFCTEVIAGARLWLAEIATDPIYQKHYNSFVRHYPAGLPPYIVGVPVVA